MEQSINVRDAKLTKRIMRRVYLISAIRLTLHPTTMKVVLAALLFFRSMKYVSYEHVFANMTLLPNLSAGFQFAKGAMFHAHPMTLVLLSSVAWLSAWIVADSVFRKQQSWL
jgi:hypothetical protein